MAAKLSDGVMTAAAKLDVGMAIDLGQVPVRPVYYSDSGAKVTMDAFALAGLHSVRARFPASFPAADVEASRQWLAANDFLSLAKA